MLHNLKSKQNAYLFSNKLMPLERYLRMKTASKCRKKNCCLNGLAVKKKCLKGTRKLNKTLIGE